MRQCSELFLKRTRLISDNMNRKNFLSSVFALGTLQPDVLNSKLLTSDTLEASPFPLITPPYLKPGDTIGITCPAGDITLKEIQPALLLIDSWGFRIKVGDTVGKKDFIFGGSDSERAADFQKMLDDPGISAILCARGGYGAIHIIDQLDFVPLIQHPKWVIGFSDITVLLCHIHTNFNVASIHSKMCNSFPDDWSKAEPDQPQSILSIRQALIGGKMEYRATPHAQNRASLAETLLVGGNLKTIETLACTNPNIDTAGKTILRENTATCIETLQLWGYRVDIGYTLGGPSKNYFSGTDDRRLAELQQKLDDPEIKAVLCGRGGYGLTRIIDRVDFSRFVKSPKWIIGFSDVTVLHAHIWSNYKIATLHAPMAGAFNAGGAAPVYVESLRQTLAGRAAVS